MANNRELSQFGSFVEVADSTKLGIGASVGIGTTLPTVQLEVHGNVKTVSGKVGVQTAPTHDLQVYGQTQLDDLNVLGIATFTGAIDANGGLNISGGSALVASSLKVSDLTDNRVVIAGGSGELEDDARFTFDGSDLTVGLSSGFTVSKDGDLTLTGVGADAAAGPSLKLFRNSASPADADYIGQIKFAGESDTGVERNYAKITGKILDASNGEEDGIIEFAHIKAGSQTITGRWRSDSLQLLNGTNFSVNGNTTLEGSLDVDGHTDLDFVQVSAAATFASLVDVDGGLQADTAKIEDLTNNRVVLAGVGGELEDDGNFTFTGETVNIGAQLTVSGVSTFSSSVQAASFVTGASGAAIGVNTNTISGPAEMFIDPSAVGDNTGVLRIKGDLYVDGTTTQINSTTLEIADFVVGIASTATTDSLADGAGINIGPDNTFKYDHTNTSLKSSENLNVASGKTYKVNGTDVLSATTLGGAVVNSSLTSVGTLSALTVSGDVSIADKIIHTGDTNTALRFPENDTVTVETDGSERLRITSGGSVGIGTNSPNFSSFGSNTGGLEISDVNTNNALLVQSGANEFYFANTSSANYIWGDDNVPLSIATNDTERLRITAAGNVLIGTTTEGDTAADNLTIADSGASGITIRSGTTSTGNIYFSDATSGSGEYDGYIQYSQNDRHLILGTAAAEKLRITSAGNIGIGLTNPTSKLQVANGHINLSSGYSIQWSDSHERIEQSDGKLEFFTANGEKMTLSGDNVGIGTNNPSNLLHIDGETDQLKLSDGTGSFEFRAGNVLKIKDNGTERLRVDSNGSLLINGTSTFGAPVKLQVRGASSALSDGAQIFDVATTATATGGTRLAFGVNEDTYSWIRSYESGVGSRDLVFAGVAEYGRFDASGRLLINKTTNRDQYYGGTYTGQLQVEGTNDATRLTQFIHNTNAASQPIVVLGKSRGTSVGSYTVVQNGDYLGTLSFQGADGDEMIEGARIDAIVSAAPGADDMPTALSFGVTADGASGTTERLRITSAGNIGINSTTPAVKLDIRSTDAIRVPVGTTGERPTGAAGYIRYNSSIASYEGHNGSEWAGIGGAAEVETSVSSTSATTCESFAKTSYRSASIVAQITQGSSYQVGNYLLIHDGTTATLIEESAVATGDMLGTFTATISGSNVVFQVNMASASSATVTTKMTKVSIP